MPPSISTTKTIIFWFSVVVRIPPPQCISQRHKWMWRRLGRLGYILLLRLILVTMSTKKKQYSIEEKICCMMSTIGLNRKKRTKQTLSLLLRRYRSRDIPKCPNWLISMMMIMTVMMWWLSQIRPLMLHESLIHGQWTLTILISKTTRKSMAMEAWKLCHATTTTPRLRRSIKMSSLCHPKQTKKNRHRWMRCHRR